MPRRAGTSELAILSRFNGMRPRRCSATFEVRGRRKKCRLMTFDGSPPLKRTLAAEWVFPFELGKPREIGIGGVKDQAAFDGECGKVCVCGEVSGGVQRFEHAG